VRADSTNTKVLFVSVVGIAEMWFYLV